MSLDEINLIKNPTFRLREGRPAAWRLESPSAALIGPLKGPRGLGVVISRISQKPILLEQTLACEPEQWYRLEFVFSADWERSDAGGALQDDASADAGLRIVAEAFDARRRPLVRRRTPPVSAAAAEKRTLRLFFATCVRAKRLRIGISIQGVVGGVRLHEARLMPILEPEHDSHPFALPPPSHMQPAPLRPKRVEILCDDAPWIRQAPQWLPEFDVHVHDKERASLGRASTSKGAGDRSRRAGRAIILQGARPPREISDFKSLFSLAERNIVMVSLPIFARLAGAGIRVRTVRQWDDPIHARVTWNGYATRGFALHDAFPFAWDEGRSGLFVQRHLLRGRALVEFCEKHELRPMLTSLGDQEVTSDRVAALCRTWPRGALFIVDLDSLSAEPSSLSEVAFPVHLLRGMLGLQQQRLGQYVAAKLSESSLRNGLRVMATQYAGFDVEEADVPVEELTRQVVHVGGRAMMGLADARPIIEIATDDRAGDLESFAGALFWIRELVRMPPHACPYRDELLSRFRIEWAPLAAGFHRETGWESECGSFVHSMERRQGTADGGHGPTPLPGRGGNGRASAGGHGPAFSRGHDLPGELTPSRAEAVRRLKLAARAMGQRRGGVDLPAGVNGAPQSASTACRIRIETSRVNRFEVCLCGGHPDWRVLLPRLWRTFPPGASCSYDVEEGRRMGRLGGRRWRVGPPPLRISESAAMGQGREAGDSPPVPAVLIRAPRRELDFAACSIATTDVIATLLEYVVGLVFGLLLVNRRDEPMKMLDRAALSPGEAILYSREDEDYQRILERIVPEGAAC